VVQTKGVGTHPKKQDILKQFRTHFKAKHVKGMGTPFQCVPALLHPCRPDKVCRPNVFALNLSIKCESLLAHLAYAFAQFSEEPEWLRCFR